MVEGWLLLCSTVHSSQEGLRGHRVMPRVGAPISIQDRSHSSYIGAPNRGPMQAGLNRFLSPVASSPALQAGQRGVEVAAACAGSEGWSQAPEGQVGAGVTGAEEHGRGEERGQERARGGWRCSQSPSLPPAAPGAVLTSTSLRAGAAPACPSASPGQSNQGVGEDFAPGGQEPLCAAKAAPAMRVNSSGAAAGELSSSGTWARSSRRLRTPVLW